MTSRGAAPPFSREASRPGHFDGDYLIGFIDGSLGNDYGLAPDGRFLMMKRGPAEQG